MGQSAVKGKYKIQLGYPQFNTEANNYNSVKYYTPDFIAKAAVSSGVFVYFWELNISFKESQSEEMYLHQTTSNYIDQGYFPPPN